MNNSVMTSINKEIAADGPATSNRDSSARVARARHDRTVLAVMASMLSAAVPGIALASSHAEAPFVKSRPKLDASDFYLFSSYEEGRENYVTLIANYIPLQDAYGGPNFAAMNDNAIYELHIDNDGDAVEDLTFLFDFDNGLRNAGEGLSLQIGDQTVAVPLKNIGPLGNLDNRDVLNVNDTYFVGITTGDRRSESPVWATRSDSGTRIFAKPYDYVGTKSFPGGYDNYVRSITNSGDIYYDVTFEQCPEGAQDGRVFVGQRKDSFSIALAEIFDLVNMVPLVDALPDDPARNDLADKNVTTLAVEVHKDCAVGDGNGVIGGWTTASVRANQALQAEPTYRRPVRYSGQYQQVSRLGSPLVNEVVIGLPDKDRFNASEPKDDGQFATYVTHPTLPALIDALFREPLGASDNIAPSNLPRIDLVTAFLTGFAGVNQMATVTPSEMLRLNTGIPATAKDDQANLGVAAGDLAGFPNGRRPGDDITDIALRVVMGALCHPIGVDLDASGTAGDAGDNLGLCTPEDAPVGTAPLTDGAPQNAGQFDATFPYLTTPVTGSPSGTASMPTDPGGPAAPMEPSQPMVPDQPGSPESPPMTPDQPTAQDDGDCPVDAGSIFAGSPSDTELELVWAAAAPSAGVTGYEVFVDGSLFLTTDDPTATMGSLDPATDYFVEVVPVSSDGDRFDCLPPLTLSTSG